MKLLIIGLGLIGGSIAKAAKKYKLASEIAGMDINLETINYACEEDIIDTAITNLEDISDYNLIIVSTPISAVKELLQNIKPYINPETILVDVCSVKHGIKLQAKEILGTLYENYVPTHPIAGTEINSIKATSADLFQERPIIVCPDNNTSLTSINFITSFFEGIGAYTEIMDSDEHDILFAALSHLPHVICFTFLNSLTDNKLHFSGGSFNDLTRVAKSNPIIWRDIFLANKENILKRIKNLQVEINKLANLIESEATEELLTYISSAKAIKDNI